MIYLKELISGAEKELLKILGIDVSDIQILNVEFPSVRERRVDKVYLCIIGSKRFIIQIEFQIYYEKYFTENAGILDRFKIQISGIPNNSNCSDLR